MNSKDLHTIFFQTVIEDFLIGKTSRDDVATLIAHELALDSVKGDANDLLPNCEWALRHIAEPDFQTSMRELKYYLSCLKGERPFSKADRDLIVSTPEAS